LGGNEYRKQIFYFSNEEIYLIGFVSDDIAGMLTDYNSEITVPVFSSYSSNRNVLVVLPIKKILKAKDRDIEEDGKTRYLLDITLK
jgi:hypothetical protein